MANSPGGGRWPHAIPGLAVEYAAAIQAPAKDLILLDGLGHMAMLIRPERIETELRTRILPLATGAGSRCPH